ncbi:MAG: hypothetical protein ABFD83_13915 [Armatimonadota bacterium]
MFSIFSKAANIVKSLVTMRLLLGLIEPIRDLVKTYETPGLPGANKKQSVMSLIKIAIVTGEGAFNIDLPDDLILRFASDSIDAIVDAENLAGRFKHSTTSGTTSTPATGTTTGAN